MTNLKEIEKKAVEFGNDLERVNRELKRLASIKTRLKKQKGRASYEDDMKKVLCDEQIMKEVKQLINPKKKPVTEYNQEDVDRLDYDETVKAILSIQSKKSLTRWLTTEEGNNDEFRNACKVEDMLKAHRDKVQPVEAPYVRKSDLVTIIDTIESNKDLSQEKIVELLKGLL